MRVLYRVRPYEKVKGSANHLHEVWKKRCIKYLEKARYGEFKKNIRGIIRDFDRLEETSCWYRWRNPRKIPSRRKQPSGRTFRGRGGRGSNARFIRLYVLLIL